MAEKIKRVELPPAAGYVPLDEFLRRKDFGQMFTPANNAQDCPHGFMRQAGGHPADCPVCP